MPAGDKQQEQQRARAAQRRLHDVLLGDDRVREMQPRLAWTTLNGCGYQEHRAVRHEQALERRHAFGRPIIEFPLAQETFFDIEAEHVVIACGVWSPKIGDMAGISIPLTPAVHQMISVGPCPQLAEQEGEISFPIVRDMDTFCYERQHGADMEVGSYAHRAILHEPEEIPSLDQAKLSPTEMPFTEDDFDPQLEQALELMPELLGGDGAEMRYAINGLLSLTPDGLPILGETPEVKGLWSGSAVWVKEGPGVGRAMAEHIVEVRGDTPFKDLGDFARRVDPRAGRGGGGEPGREAARWAIRCRPRHAGRPGSAPDAAGRRDRCPDGCVR